MKIRHWAIHRHLKSAASTWVTSVKLLLPAFGACLRSNDEHRAICVRTNVARRRVWRRVSPRSRAQEKSTWDRRMDGRFDRSIYLSICERSGTPRIIRVRRVNPRRENRYALAPVYPCVTNFPSAALASRSKLRSDDAVRADDAPV